MVLYAFPSPFWALTTTFLSGTARRREHRADRFGWKPRRISRAVRDRFPHRQDWDLRGRDLLSGRIGAARRPARVVPPHRRHRCVSTLTRPTAPGTSRLRT